MNAIEIKSLSKYYGKCIGVSDVSLNVLEGEIYGFVGKNGAGKSTTIRTLLNLIIPTSGSAKIFGLDCVSQSKEIKKFTSYLPSEVEYYEGMKVIDLFNYTLEFCEDKCYEMIDNLTTYFELDKDKKISELSLGNRKKVSIIQCLLKKPKLIILDEPTSGLDPLMQNKFFEILLEQKKKGVTIFLSSHNLQEIEKYCDRVAIIKDGKIVEVVDMKEANIKRKLVVRMKEKGKDIEELSWDKSINELINDLSKKDLESLEIKYKSIEEEFEKYYKEENKNEKL